jgi:hypothetical protein
MINAIIYQRIAFYNNFQKKKKKKNEKEKEKEKRLLTMNHYISLSIKFI